VIAPFPVAVLVLLVVTIVRHRRGQIRDVVQEAP
jgi:heme exporter protein D